MIRLDEVFFVSWSVPKVPLLLEKVDTLNSRD